MGFIFGNMPRKYTNYSKQSKNPRRPFEKEKLINDLTTIGIYGLRCKREVWSQQLVLAKLRKAARVLLCMDETDPRRIFEGEALIKRMVRLGLLDKYQRKLDYVLGLTVHQFIEKTPDPRRQEKPRQIRPHVQSPHQTETHRRRQAARHYPFFPRQKNLRATHRSFRHLLQENRQTRKNEAQEGRW